MPPFPSHRSAVAFFESALAKFQRSSSRFEVVCTVPPEHDQNDAPEQVPPVVRPQTRPTTLVVLDSSFNPPTVAHCRMATSAIRDIPGGYRSRLLLLLAVNNADKAPKPAAFEQRLAMMLAFARDMHSILHTERTSANGADAASDSLLIDLALTSHPYFHDKSAAISSSSFYAGQDGAGAQAMEQVFLVGYDTLIRIFNPKYYSHSTPPAAAAETPMQAALSPFFNSARLRVTVRADDEWGGKAEQAAYLESLLNTDMLEKAGGKKEWARRVELVEGRTGNDGVVSSTLARAASQQKLYGQLAKFVTPRVKDWIEAEGLYTHGG